jgi:hypothetical protein
VWGEGGVLLKQVERGEIKDVLSGAVKVGTHARHLSATSFKPQPSKLRSKAD